MTGAELIRAIRKLGRRRGVEVRLVTRRGKGSHGTLYFGDFKTIVNGKKELTEGSSLTCSASSASIRET